MKMNSYQKHIIPLQAILLAGLLIAPGYVIAEDSVPESLDLEAAISQALANNPDLAAQEALTQAARDRADAAAGRRWPALGLSGGYQAYSEDTRLLGARFNGEPGVFASDFIEGAVTLKLPLYTGGQLTSEIRGADLLAQSAEGRLARSRDELIFNVGSLFHTILAQRHVIESVEFSLKAMDEHLKRVNELVAAEKAARVDALRTEVRRAELQQRLIETRNALAIQQRALANLLGLETQPLPPLDGKLELDETEKALAKPFCGSPQVRPPLRTPPLPQQLEGEAVPSRFVPKGLASASEVYPAPEDCIAAALAQRTDYRAVQQEAGAAEMARRAARGDRLPSVSLSGSYGYRQAVDPSAQPDGTDDAEAIGRVGVVVEFPLFEGGRLSAKVREAEAILEAARQRERSLRLRIKREVETALLNLSAARQRVDVAQAAVTQAEESLRIERQKYDLGKGAIVDVLDAQSALLQTQTSTYRALADLNTAIAERDLAIGKEWQ